MFKYKLKSQYKKKGMVSVHDLKSAKKTKWNTLLLNKISSFLINYGRSPLLSAPGHLWVKDELRWANGHPQAGPSAKRKIAIHQPARVTCTYALFTTRTTTSSDPAAYWTPSVRTQMEALNPVITHSFYIIAIDFLFYV
jgi:hypothetical protein